MTGFGFFVSFRVDSYLFVIVFVPKLRIFVDVFSFTFKDAITEESLALRMSPLIATFDPRILRRLNC